MSRPRYRPILTGQATPDDGQDRHDAQHTRPDNLDEPAHQRASRKTPPCTVAIPVYHHSIDPDKQLHSNQGFPALRWMRSRPTILLLHLLEVLGNLRYRFLFGVRHSDGGRDGQPGLSRPLG